MTDLTPTVEVRADPAPTAGQRVARTAGQVGGALVFLELWMAFGWFGADDWTDRQILAVSAAAYFLVGAVHNAFNWWRTERLQPAPLQAVTVAAVATDEPSTRSSRSR